MAEATKIDITANTIFRVIIILLGVWFLYLIVDVLVMLFAAVIIASAVEPVARWLQQYRIPRILSAAGVYVLALALLSGIVTLLLPPLAEQVTQLAEVLPQLVSHWQERGLLMVGGKTELVGSLQQLLLRFGGSLSVAGFDVFQRTRSFFSGAFTLLFVLIIAFYLVAEQDALKKLFRLIVPSRHFSYVAGVLDRMQHNIARWVAAQLTLGIIVGLFVGAGLWIMGVRYALVLGLVAGLLEVIPVIGPILAAIPGVLVGLSQSLLLGVVVLIFYVLVQQAENQFLVPLIMRKAIGLNPLVTLIAVLLGGRLAGVVGVILSVPAAVVISIILSDIFSDRLRDEEQFSASDTTNG